jgi:hypothetical protein
VATAVMRGRTVVVISGFHGPRAAVVDAAWEMQRRLAGAYEGSETGGGPLRANTQEYTVRKIMDGWDPRRGHRTGETQDALYSVQCFTVTGSSRSGEWTITFSDRALIVAVGDYVEYFAQAKAVGGRIVTMRRAWVDAAAATLRGAESTAPREALRPAATQEALRVVAGLASRRRTAEGVTRQGVRLGRRSA